MLNVILPCCKGDQDQAFWLLEWVAEMGKVDTLLVILCAKDCNIPKLKELGEKAFTRVHWLEDYENINSDWRSEGNQAKSAAGPNSLFRQACWYFSLNKLGPWFWIEPDAIPCYPKWLEDLDREYSKAGKPFMGFKVTRHTHPGPVGEHMSGVGAYPEQTPSYLRKAIIGNNMAFDVAGAPAMVPQMHDTPLIFHRYRPPGFTSQADFEERVPRHLAIYHAVKDGSLFPFLRQRLYVREAQLAGPLPFKQNVADPIPVTHSLLGESQKESPVVDIFIKTRPHDYDWLEWCLKSIEKHCSGFGRKIIITPDPSGLPMALNGRTVIIQEENEPGYLWQQRSKLYADKETDGEYILFQDSDTIFTRQITPSDLIKDGKPVWLYSPLDQARPDQHAWIPVMEKFLGKKPEHEFMRRHPFIVPRWAFEEIRKFCQYKHGVSLEDYIMAQAIPGHPLALRFSEWNCMGFFLWEFHHDKVCWMTPEEAGPACVWQGFSHAGEDRKQQDIAKFKELLGSTPLVGAQVQEEVTSPPAPLTEKEAIRFLASQVRNNFHKARIVRKLKKAWKGMGEMPKRIKKAISVPVSGRLLCIHSYPGANDTVFRHWPYFERFGATRIVGIGTTDGKCEFPGEFINIGENSYMDIQKPDDHLCRRLLDTVKWCLTQPEDKFAIIEYDTLPLKKMPEWFGVSACLTGGQVNGSIATQFFHNPWLFDRTSGQELVRALEQVLPNSASYPNNSPDLFFGLACERAAITVGCIFNLFTRNRLDDPEDLALACKLAREGYHIIHGVKTEAQFNAIEKSLNTRELPVSNIA